MIRRNSARPRQRLSCIAVLLLGVGLLPATVAVAPPADAAPASTPAAAIAAETGLFTPLPTARVFDGTATSTTRQVQFTGQGGVPTSATAVMVNTEVFAPTAAGYVRVTPPGWTPVSRPRDLPAARPSPTGSPSNWSTAESRSKCPPAAPAS